MGEARTAIRQGLTAATERGARGHQAPLLRLLAEVLAREDPAGTSQRLERALALAAELGMRPEAGQCHLALGRLCRRTGKRQDAQEHLSTARAMFREMAMGFWLAQAEQELEQREEGPP